MKTAAIQPKVELSNAEAQDEVVALGTEELELIAGGECVVNNLQEIQQDGSSFDETIPLCAEN